MRLAPAAIARHPFQSPVAAHPLRRWGLATVAVGLARIALFATPGCAAPPGGNAAVTEPAKAAVVTFLEAMKRGDDAAARGMLTQLARAKTQEMGLSVAPPVNDTATYTVRGAETVSDDNEVVHVATTWTDVDPDGFKSTDNVVWVVRLDPEGWRVVGMAMKVFDDLPPLLLNFEDPEDMIAKQNLVATELMKRAQQGAAGQAGPRTAQGTAAPAVR
jgi:hypothetical protein